MKPLAARLAALERQIIPPPEMILVAQGTDEADWPKPASGSAVYVIVDTGVDREGDAIPADIEAGR